MADIQGFILHCICKQKYNFIKWKQYHFHTYAVQMQMTDCGVVWQIYQACSTDKTDYFKGQTLKILQK